jgi:hypothetical protein
VVRGLIGIALVLGLPRQNAAQVPADQIWEDLDYLIEQVAEIHPVPFRVHARAEWTRRRALAVERAPLSHAELYAEVLRMIALASDGHMDAYPPEDHNEARAAVPLKLVPFPEGLYVTAADPAYRRVVGRRVLAIEGMASAEVIDRLRILVPSDNNPGTRELTEDYLRMPLLLQAVGVGNSEPGIQLTFEADDGPVVYTVDSSAATDDLPVGPPRRPTPPGWIDARGASALPLWQRHLERIHWLEPMPDLDAVYVQLNRVIEDRPGTLRQLADQMTRAADSLGAARLVLDVRANRGGDATLLQPLLHAILRQWQTEVPGTVFVLTSSYTFSAAVHLAADLERNTHAIFVGEPTAAPPNHYADVTTVTLPNSGIEVEISRLYWQKSDPRDHRDAMYPDVVAPLRWLDFVQGRDPAMDAVRRLDRADPGLSRTRSPVFNWMRPSQQRN